jgi:hypothetical protein
MNPTLKAVIVELSGSNVRDSRIDLQGVLGLSPEDSLGDSDAHRTGIPGSLQIGGEIVETDIDETKAVFRAHGAVDRFFSKEAVAEGDLILIERVEPRAFRVSKASKRGFKYYL